MNLQKNAWKMELKFKERSNRGNVYDNHLPTFIITGRLKSIRNNGHTCNLRINLEVPRKEKK